MGFLLSAGLALASGLFQKKQQDKAFKQDEKNYQRNDLVKTMKDAQDAGFHPLEALRAGYTQTQVAQAPRISSVSVAANAVDQIASMYRDETQRKTNNALIEAQIANINADTARMGNVSENAVRLASSGAAAAAASSASAVPLVTSGPHAGQENERLKEREAIALSDGSTSTVTVGPDIDELLSGAVFEAGGFFRTRERAINENKTARIIGQRVHDIDAPMLWPFELGDQPDNWENMSQMERVNAVRRINPNFAN